MVATVTPTTTSPGLGKTIFLIWGHISTVERHRLPVDAELSILPSCLPEAVICASMRRYRDTASTCRCPHSPSPTTACPVLLLNLAWRESSGFCVCLNFSTLSFCCIMDINRPRINFTQLWKRRNWNDNTSLNIIGPPNYLLTSTDQPVYPLKWEIV